MIRSRSASLALLVLAAAPVRVHAGVTLVEGGHTLNQIVDSSAPLHPSQTALDTDCVFGDAGNVESIAVDPGTGTLYVQISEGGGGDDTGDNTCIFAVSPAGVVSAVNLDTGLRINDRGTDLQFDSSSGLLVTMDGAGGGDMVNAEGGLPGPGPSDRIATVNPVGGAVGTFSLVTAPVFDGGTFGMGFSTGAGGSVVPAGSIVFTSDLSANGIHSAPPAGAGSTEHVEPTQAGDDMVIQPDGDWVHFPDGDEPLTAYRPFPPFTATPGAPGISFAGLFLDEKEESFGTRATVCDTTGEVYISFSGLAGGDGVYRVNEPLTAAAELLAIDEADGLHDLIVGPSSSGGGRSLYLALHDLETGTEEVWEVTLPECPSPSGIQEIPGLAPGGMALLAALLLAAGVIRVARRGAAKGRLAG